MNAFDKICAVLAFPFGVIFLILGVVGLFYGCSANFTLPPVLGVAPAFVGWGIVRAVIVGWRQAPPGEPADNLAAQGTMVDRPASNNPYEPPRY